MIQAIDITAEQRVTVRSLLARHLPNTEAWVYGSRVRWTSRPESDLDIAVFATPDQARDVSDLREAFEDSNLPFRVDLFVWDEVPESFRQEIEREHVVVAEADAIEATSQASRASESSEVAPRHLGSHTEIVGALDNKIELNRRMNETLEAMARALFKSWFVDFEPVRAKMEGCETALPLHISSLFPARLAQVEPQEIPVGWRTYSLEELAEHHTATVSPVATPDATFLHYSIPAYDAGQTPTLEFGAEIKSNKTLVPHDAVLLSKLNPNIPRVWAASQSYGSPQICSTEFLAFTPSAVANRSLLFSLFCDHAFRTMLLSLVTGTSKSHQRVPPGSLKAQLVIVGAPAVFRAFDKLATPSLERTVANRAESEMLARIRSTLLPGLISGEIHVQQAEQILGKML